MNRIVTNHELWNLPSEQISKMSKGRPIRIVQTNGEVNEITVKELLLAANPPHLFTGFRSTDNEVFSLPLIDYVELI